jgi:hypothetical protein
MDKTINQFGLDIEKQRTDLSKARIAANQMVSENPSGFTLSPNGKSTEIHELQHAIQEREGFSPGGSSAMAFSNPEAWEIYKGLLGDMHTPMLIKDYAKQAWGTDSITQELSDAYKQYVKQTKSAITPEIDRAAQETAGKEYYRRLAGEAEARATQARIPLDAAQRRALFPEDSYDVPINQLIIRGLLK